MTEQTISTDVAEFNGVTGTVVSTVEQDIQSFKNDNVSVYSTFQGDGFQDRLKVIQAMTNATPLRDVFNKPFNLANYVLQGVQITDPKTGEVTDAIRTILVTDKGETYHAVSSGIVSALKTLNGIVGHPSEWPEPVKVVATEDQTRAGYRVTTLKFA